MKERPILFSGAMVRAILEGRKTQTRRIVKHKYPHLDHEPWYATGRVLTDLPTQPGAWMEFRYRQQDDPGFEGSPASTLLPCPYGQPGDGLWVRETWQGPLMEPDTMENEYRADPAKFHSPEYCVYAADGGDAPEFVTLDDELVKRWRPSIHMPRWASRILLEITAVRVERLQDISEDDVLAEGFLTREGKDAFNVYGSREFFIPEMLDKNPSGRVASGANSSAQQAYRNLWESINGAVSWDANPWVWVVEFKRVMP